VSRTVCLTLPDDIAAALCTRAGEGGFFGKYALSSFIRHAAVSFSRLGHSLPASGIRPIIAHPSSEAQRQGLADYAQVKGHESLEAYALHAMVTMMAKNVLTDTQKDEIARMVAEREISRQR